MHSLEIKRQIAAPLNKVFRAWTDPVQMGQWFFPKGMQCKVSSDFRVGGAYQIEMWKEEGDSVYVHSGHYFEIEAEKRIGFTWNSHIAKDSRVVVEFEAKGSETLLTLSHTLLDTEERRDMHSVGWNGCLNSLAEHLATKAAVGV